MIYLLGIALILSYATISWIVWQGRKERTELEDRLMSITQPVALITHKAVRDDDPGDVTYVDEAREAELSPSWNPAP